MDLAKAVAVLWGRSSQLRTGRCAVILTDDDATLVLILRALQGLECEENVLGTYASKVAKEVIHTARAPFVRLFVIDVQTPAALDAISVASWTRDDLPKAHVIAINVTPENFQAVYKAGASIALFAPTTVEALRATAETCLLPTTEEQDGRY